MIHIYTGEGKGKTTASLGLALRAEGAGLKVFIGQFLKGKKYSELASLKKLKNIKVEQFGTRCFITKKPSASDIALARGGLARIQDVISSKKFDVVILDEANIAIHLGLLSLDEVLDTVRSCPECIELVFTGRYAPPALKRCADYVTEMKEIKHPFKKKITGRRGIEF
ncbi:MAG TPA: cob(I)yrinic acid a,c-diamide adenosyltransferase [Candidatus Omnitrophota bacterium]|nr:cob(I)yrinic acid a,c-diamide adenosyltransferase [Candidatus Omnitrophota bacterium]